MTTAKTKPVRKAGRQKGSKNKAKPVAVQEVVAEDAPKASVNPDVQALLEYIGFLSSNMEALEAKVESLEHQAIQYQAVISYLEAKLDI